MSSYSKEQKKINFDIMYQAGKEMQKKLGLDKAFRQSRILVNLYGENFIKKVMEISVTCALQIPEQILLTKEHPELRNAFIAGLIGE